METRVHSDRIVRQSPTDRLRAVLAAGVLLGTAAVVGIPILRATEFVQTALGYGGNFALTFVVGGSLATLALGVIALAYLRVHPVTIPVRRPTRREWGWVLLAIVVPAVTMVLAVLAMEALGVMGSTTNLFSRAAAQEPVLVHVAAFWMFLLLVGPMEELLYRGVVQGRLRQSFGPGVAIGLTAVLFALGHVATYWYGGSEVLSAGVAIALAQIAVYAVVVGWVYERTENLAVVVIAHSLFDAVFVALALAMLL